MSFSGLLIGLFSFIVVGILHPIAVKCKNHYSYRVWPVFLATGLLFLVVSLLTEHVTASAIFGVTGVACLWSIGELREQTELIQKDWFPANPDRLEE